VFTDSRIENEVRAALHADPRVRHPELIAVSVDEISTVVLRGAVESLPQREAAVHDARQVDGAFVVVADELKVHLPVEVHLPVAKRRADDEIAAAVMQQLVWDRRIRSTHLHVNVSQGWATVSGSASRWRRSTCGCWERLKNARPANDSRR
jgi:osmotically-inducible protein OsmY